MKELPVMQDAARRPVNMHKAYHAHVYFDEATHAFAADLCQRAGQRFGLRVGRVHQELVGPHPRWSCQPRTVWPAFALWLRSCNEPA